VVNSWKNRKLHKRLLTSLSMGAGACRCLMMPGANTWLCAPLQNSSIEKSEKYRQSKTTCPDLCHVQRITAQKWHQLKRKKRKKLYECRTTLRSSSIGLELCITYVKGHRTVHGTFGENTKWNTFQNKRWCSVQKSITFSAGFRWWGAWGGLRRGGRSHVRIQNV